RARVRSGRVPAVPAGRLPRSSGVGLQGDKAGPHRRPPRLTLALWPPGTPGGFVSSRKGTPMSSLYTLPAGHVLTATIFDGVGYVRRTDNPQIGGRLTNAAPAVYGPYLAPHDFEVQGEVSVVITEAST